MASRGYFSNIPAIEYGSKVARNLISRPRVKEFVLRNPNVIYDYVIKDGERPDTIANDYYGNPNYAWLVMLANNIVDPYYDWPLDSFSFQEYIKDKYSNPDGIHHYEVTQSSGRQTGEGPADYSHKLEVNSTHPGAQSVSNREYEQREQDKKRQIRILSPQYLAAFEEEFVKLIRR